MRLPSYCLPSYRPSSYIVCLASFLLATIVLAMTPAPSDPSSSDPLPSDPLPSDPSSQLVGSESPSPDTMRVPSGFDVQGHRGARGLRPENTIPAFRHALELGVPTLELDVVISADGEVVVSHEPWMSHVICRQPDGSPIAETDERRHNLFEMTYDEIAAYDCGSTAHPRFPEQVNQPAVKPLLREVVKMAEAFVRANDRGPVFYNVETKIRPKWEGTFVPGPERFADLVAEVLTETGVVRRSTIQSFDPRTLIVAHHREVPARLALLVSEGGDRGMEQNLKMLPFTPDVYSPDYTLVDADLLDDAHDRGMLVIPWTVNDPSDMRRLVDLGVDGLITDYPDRGLEAAGI